MAGAGDVDDVVITVVDTLPPEVACTTNVAALWPPDHKMVVVHVYIDATDSCVAPVDLVLLQVTLQSNEPDDANGLGDGATTGDTDGQDGYSNPLDVTGNFIFNPLTASFEGSVSLRAERDGTGHGRHYSIRALVLDTAKNLATTSCVVVVPHDRRKN